MSHQWFYYNLTLVLLNPDIPCLCKQCRARSVGSNWSGSALFVIYYVNLYQQPGSGDQVIWLADNHKWAWHLYSAFLSSSADHAKGVPLLQFLICLLFISTKPYFKGWSQDRSKSDGCFSQYLNSSPWSCYEDYNISFCKQWKFRCHCSYEQWHLLNLHFLQRGQSCP